MASEEWNCLSQYKRFITRKESTGIKTKYRGPQGGYLQAGGNLCLAEGDVLVTKWFSTLGIKASVGLHGGSKNPI